MVTDIDVLVVGAGPAGVAAAIAAVPMGAHGLSTDVSRWGVPNCFPVTGSAGASRVLDRMYYEPFRVERTITVTDIGIDIITPASAGNKARLNIFAATSAWQAGARQLVDAEVSADSGGLKTRTGLSLTLTPGIYLASLQPQATILTRAVSMSGDCFIGSNIDVWSTWINEMYASLAYVATPSTGTAWVSSGAALVTTAGFIHGIWMKWTTP